MAALGFDEGVAVVTGAEAWAEAKRERTEQSFLVPKAEIAGNDYDLSINRYKQVVHAAVQHAPPKEIIAELQALEEGIAKELNELEGMIA